MKSVEPKQNITGGGLKMQIFCPRMDLKCLKSMEMKPFLRKYRKRLIFYRKKNMEFASLKEKSAHSNY